MKKILFTVAMMAAIAVNAKDIHVLVVKTTPEMHCENCENKIKKNVRFAKGVKSIETNLEKQTVTIEYDADKGTQEGITKEFKKIGFEVKVVSDKKQEEKKK